LRRREEHPHSLGGCRDSEIQAMSPPRVPLVFQGCAWCYRNPPAFRRCPCFKHADARCTWHSKGAPGISMCTCNFHGRTGRYRGAPACLQSTGAPWEWQVRPVSNKRMPGAPDAYVISQGAPEWQILNHWPGARSTGRRQRRGARRVREGCARSVSGGRVAAAAGSVAPL
jgi:hypothetical protein